MSMTRTSSLFVTLRPLPLLRASRFGVFEANSGRWGHDARQSRGPRLPPELVACAPALHKLMASADFWTLHRSPARSIELLRDHDRGGMWIANVRSPR